jgi:hypothetical protein
METLNMCKNRPSNGSNEHLHLLIINNKFATLTFSTTMKFLKKMSSKKWIEIEFKCI